MSLTLAGERDPEMLLQASARWRARSFQFTLPPGGMERAGTRSTKAEYFMSDDNETLLIDDDEADVELALHALRGKKLVNQILVLRDGEEALDYLFGPGREARSASGQTPKLILLDLKLPKVYGVEVLRRLEHVAKSSC